jgi:hypothetical protein
MNFSPLKVATNTKIFEIEALSQPLGDPTTRPVMVSIKNFYTDCRNLLPKVIARIHTTSDFLSILYGRKGDARSSCIPIVGGPL